MNDRKGSLLIQHRSLFTAPEDVPIHGIEVARKTRILVVLQNLLDRRKSIESSILAIVHANEIEHTLLG